MAVFYDHIKGVDASGSSTSYITFKDNDYPMVSLSGSVNTSLGQILTTSGNTQTIVNNKKIKFGTSYYLTGDTSFIIGTSDSTALLTITPNTTTLVPSLSLTNNLTIGGTTSFGGSIDSDIDASSHHIIANYFVATSDKNYKENFKDLPSTLDFINSTKLYTFNYKSTPNDRNIGMIAQDVESTTFNDFNLVLDITSNGKSFKAIKETKLVYILWKGVQEESGKIKALEEKVAALEEKSDAAEKRIAELEEKLDKLMQVFVIPTEIQD